MRLQGLLEAYRKQLPGTCRGALGLELPATDIGERPCEATHRLPLSDLCQRRRELCEDLERPGAKPARAVLRAQSLRSRSKAVMRSPIGRSGSAARARARSGSPARRAGGRRFSVVVALGMAW